MGPTHCSIRSRRGAGSEVSKLRWGRQSRKGTYDEDELRGGSRVSTEQAEEDTGASTNEVRVLGHGDRRSELVGGMFDQWLARRHLDSKASH